MSSDLDYETRCEFYNIKKARLAQEYYDEQQRIYKMNKLKRDLEYEREEQEIRRAHKSKIASRALDEIHMLSDRIRELEKVIRENTSE